jgi:phage terminase large subunit-like protein
MLNHLKLAADPAYFFQVATGFIADPWQRRLLEEAAGIGSDFKKFHALTGRQCGKTEVCSVLLLWWLVFHRPATTAIIASPAERTSRLMFDKVGKHVRRLPPGLVEVAGENATELRLAIAGRGESLLVALPGGEQGRGYTSTLAVVDEASRVDSDLWASVTPTLSTTGGTLVLLSTGNLPVGKFYEVHRDRPPDWRFTEIRSDQNPRVTKEYLDSERRELGWRYAAEHECSFLGGAGGNFFDLAAIDRASESYNTEMLF